MKKKIYILLIPLILYGLFLVFLCEGRFFEAADCYDLYSSLDARLVIPTFFIIWYVFAFPKSKIVEYLKNITSWARKNPYKNKTYFFFGFIRSFFWSFVAGFVVGLSFYRALSFGNGFPGFILSLLIISLIYSGLYTFGLFINRKK